MFTYSGTYSNCLDPYHYVGFQLLNQWSCEKLQKMENVLT
jgi:hypothetical protein